MVGSMSCCCTSSMNTFICSLSGSLHNKLILNNIKISDRDTDPAFQVNPDPRHGSAPKIEKIQLKFFFIFLGKKCNFTYP
jgi:hypothetical protein